MKNVKNYTQLKADIIALKEYVDKLDIAITGTTFSIDDVLSEMNDLLLGIENGQLVLPYKQLMLVSTYFATDGVFDDNVKLKKMIHQIQNDIYSIRKHIIVQQKPWFYFRKKYENVNWLFPNLNCKNGYIKCIEYEHQDMLEITFHNGYEIDLGYLENEYVITITKNDDWTNIIEEEHIKLRSMVEEKLQNFIYKYEKL